VYLIARLVFGLMLTGFKLKIEVAIGLCKFFLVTSVSNLQIFVHVHFYLLYVFLYLQVKGGMGAKTM
jgi:hypothetical protein